MVGIYGYPLKIHIMAIQFGDFMWYLVAAVVIAVGITTFLAPKPPSQKPQDVKTPASKEGGKIRKIYGTVWIEDPIVLGFKKIGTDAIRKKGGKK